MNNTKTMPAVTQYKFEEQQIKASIQRVNLWIKQLKEHKKSNPNEVSYRDYLYNRLIEQYDDLLRCEPYLERPIFKELYQEKFCKAKLLAKKLLSL